MDDTSICAYVTVLIFILVLFPDWLFDTLFCVHRFLHDKTLKIVCCTIHFVFNCFGVLLTVLSMFFRPAPNCPRPPKCC